MTLAARSSSYEMDSMIGSRVVLGTHRIRNYPLEVSHITIFRHPQWLSWSQRSGQANQFVSDNLSAERTVSGGQDSPNKISLTGHDVCLGDSPSAVRPHDCHRYIHVENHYLSHTSEHDFFRRR